MKTFPLPDWPRAFGGPAGRGVLKASPEDFQVEEILGFEPSGAGEHVFLWVEKRALNTEQVAEQLGRFAGVPRRQVSYAGLKDRQAQVKQWFCIHLPGKRELPWQECQGEGFRVLRWTRNRRRLRKGVLAGNRFRLRIRDFAGDYGALAKLLQQIADAGLPNYFGLQRFGLRGANLAHAEAMLTGAEKVRSRHHRGLYLSAARALIFNQLLAQRIEQGNWNRALPGELLLFDGSRAYFRAEDIDPQIEQRVAALEIHPSGPLWGQGERATLEAGGLEAQAAARWPHLAQGLENATKAMRRPLRVRVTELQWRLEAGRLELAFVLPAGSYATILVRELIDIEGEIL